MTNKYKQQTCENVKVMNKLLEIECLSNKIKQQMNKNISESIQKETSYLKDIFQKILDSKNKELHAKLTSIDNNQKIIMRHLKIFQEDIIHNREDIQNGPKIQLQKDQENKYFIEQQSQGYQNLYEQSIFIRDQDQDQYRYFNSSVIEQNDSPMHKQYQNKEYKHIIDYSSVIDIEEQDFFPQQFRQLLNERFEQMEIYYQSLEPLYKYPEMKQISFHQKIGQKDNILFLAQLKNNKNLIGAFTENCFKSKNNFIPKSNPKSFLCNLTLDHFVYANRTNKTHTYDPNYLIFGNWQIKIKNGSTILQTTWGSNADSFSKKKYNAEGDLIKQTRSWLFGAGNTELKQIEIEKYQIYQLKKHQSRLK